MKLLLLSVALVAMSIGARQEPAAAAKEGSGKLEIERGFVSALRGWYQDEFGLVCDSDTDRMKPYKLAVTHEGTETVLVRVSSNMESGIALVLRFRYDVDRVVECTASGRWRRDFGSTGSDFAGTLEDLSGFVRLGSDDRGQRRTLACLFAIHGVVTRGHKEGDPPDLVMGGFEINDPFGQPAESK